MRLGGGVRGLMMQGLLAAGMACTPRGAPVQTGKSGADCVLPRSEGSGGARINSDRALQLAVYGCPYGPYGK